MKKPVRINGEYYLMNGDDLDNYLHNGILDTNNKIKLGEQ